MRRAYRRMWKVVPCASNKSLNPESNNIEEILSAKLATIMEEPESSCEEDPTPTRYNWRVSDKKRKKKIRCKKNTMGCMFLPRFSLAHSYALFVTGFASKGSFGGLLQY